MTIGQKIIHLREAGNFTREQIAEKLSLPVETIWDWEGDRVCPKWDEIQRLCGIFGISDDEFRDKTEPDSEDGCRYFGTDGFRGEANADLTAMHAYKIGRFLGWYYASPLSGCMQKNYRPRVVIGKDTRRSSYMLEYAIAAGLTSSGADAYMLHVTTTPCVSYAVRQDRFDCGIMITASHNPFTDNGIKIINSHGEKPSDEATRLIEAYLDGKLWRLGVSGDDLPLAQGEKIGCIVDHVSGRNRYVGYLISLASNSYKNLRIGIDAANGASWSIARSVFGALGAQLYMIGDEPDGVNVNRDCGSTHMEGLCALVREKHLDIGFAFDGDADRCLAVDEKGNVVDGDAIMYILAKRLKGRGMLGGDTVAATVMSNSGFVESLRKIGIRCVQTAVGDRFVYECMQNNDFSLGGEQSGHIILKKYATTGDGLLTAIMVAEEVCDTKSTLSELASPVVLYPQFVKNVRVCDKDAVMEDEGVKKRLCEAEESLSGRGRVLLRRSGTEPVIRIMVESETDEKCRLLAESIAEAVREGGHILE
ncbi:MAG: phosphoglucosamine mutase [Ruminococcaceae bacterium]|nr:phosphoglucosamine mutase [Oscillospiraceae bacterium]